MARPAGESAMARPAGESAMARPASQPASAEPASEPARGSRATRAVRAARLALDPPLPGVGGADADAAGLPPVLGWVGGIDEAGRGPVVGPLVVAGVACLDPDVVAQMGCTDSKLLSPDRRQALDRQLRADRGLRIEVRVIDADVLDAERRAGTSLNAIEAKRFNVIACSLQASLVYVDAADVDARRFGRQVAKGLGRATKVVSEHRADVSYPIVGAASIVAKVARDAAVAALARRLERHLDFPLGSGYASDPRTQRFLQEWVKAHGTLPEGARQTWATSQELVAPKATRLERFT